MKYEPQILLQQAETLNHEADMIVLQTAAIWGITTFVLAIVGALVFAAVQHVDFNDLFGFVVIIALIATLLGIREGRKRAFMLRLEAQKVMWLIQIENNTRSDNERTSHSLATSATAPTASATQAHVGN